MDEWLEIPDRLDPRSDSQSQGLSRSVAQDIVTAASGTLVLDRSDLGGLAVRIQLPLARPV